MSPAGRVDSVVIDSDVNNYTLSSLFPATEYEISLNAVRASQESKVVSTSVFTGGEEASFGPYGVWFLFCSFPLPRCSVKALAAV